MSGRQARFTGIATALILALAPTAGTASAPAFAASRPAAPAPAPAAPAPAAAAPLKIQVDSANQTVQGEAITTPLPGSGGDYARLHVLGTVAVSAPDGRTLWQQSAASLYPAWHLTFARGITPPNQEPQVPAIRVSPSPFQISGMGQDGVADLHPLASGYLAGIGAPVIATAETVGHGAVNGSVNLMRWPVNVVGSKLHYGTVVTVFDGRTGRVLYSELDPGFVTQLAITGGKLL